MANTDEYNALMKCTMKECPEFRAVAFAQAKLSNDLEQLTRSNMPPKERVRSVIRINKALKGMEDQRRSLMCTIGKCMDAFVALEMRKTDIRMENLMIEALKPSSVKPTRRTTAAKANRSS